MHDADDIIALIPRLRRYARALTARDATQADDLVQDTLERAWMRLHLWRRGTDLRAWLFSIMHNVHVNQLRAAHGKQCAALEDEALTIPVRATQDDDLELRDLQALLQRLPVEQRTVLLLVGLEQMSYAEVAVVLSIPIGTVMSRLSRGRERLRVLLAGNADCSSLKVVK